ncbi:Acetyltransferase (GNAT) domain-containing protein [Pseudovibrio sp. Tun.PSC04-5.I4]|nr:Acetyltransferase (GNAT) domain-containing protein [Pseudovibrio sp. Tun.PSC04-5.I4]
MRGFHFLLHGYGWTNPIFREDISMATIPIPQTVHIHELAESDAIDLLKFERANKSFFEKWVPARTEDYFELESLKEIIRELVMDEDHFFLVRNEEYQLIGRINLRAAGASTDGGAELGYRIGEAFGGKGFAKASTLALIQHLKAEGGPSS